MTTLVYSENNSMRFVPTNTQTATQSRPGFVGYYINSWAYGYRYRGGL
jgi:hypothetical protein